MLLRLKGFVTLVVFLAANSLDAAAQIKGKEYEISLRNSGVLCDGVHDDSNAINEAIDRFRRQFLSTYEVTGHIVFPSGECVVQTTLNLTNFKSKSLLIEGGGTKLIGRTAGKPVVDAIGSEYLRVRDLTVVGANERSPNIGIQIGRMGTTATESADNINFDGVAITGTFLFTALYNLNSETSTFSHLIAVNESLSPNTFTIVLDGMNHFNAKSDFVSIAQPTDVPQSFNENIFLNCDIRHNGMGVPVWIAHATRHAFIRSYIAAVHGNVGVVLYSASQADVSIQLDIDAHFETNSLDSVFRLEGNNTHPVLVSLTYRDQYPGAKISIFSAPKQSAVELRNLTLDINSMPSQALVFGGTAKWIASGSVFINTVGAWNLPNESFQGLLSLAGDVQFINRAH